MDGLNFGDLFWIYDSSGKVLTSNAQDEIVFADTSSLELDQQLLMYCGHASKPASFYLSFKYKRGFLAFSEQEKLINGVPFYERKTFTLESLSQALEKPFTTKLSEHA
ncbi:hypothetical protein INT43_008879 [Umbelopsis isabellina]|uniref:Uncharacterized protein n=1 Tax=Mortierella isabellina TaxID=91625 RepID=A0A8H7UD72_MORIS|nr:hypothetical protein INT43_008879 [Umbelopsis isabellina]